jgi:hypothetical protein
MENKSVNYLEICKVRCLSGNQELDLQECVKSGATSHNAGPGQLVHLLLSLEHDAAVSSDIQQAERRKLLQASRDASAPEQKPGRDRRNTSQEKSIDVVVEWNTKAGQHGEVYSLRVPYENPLSSASPCPVALHLLAQECAVLSPDLIVPVTLNVRNTSHTTAISFFFVADSTQEILWLGCERSEVIHLAPQASSSSVLHAYFCSCGVFNLNKFRIHLINSSSGQQPSAFTLPVERLIHIKSE